MVTWSHTLCTIFDLCAYFNKYNETSVKPINLATKTECWKQSDQVEVCWIKLTSNTVINMHTIPIYHTYIHALKARLRPIQSSVTGLWYCPVPPDPLSACPSGLGPGSVATGPWGSSAHRLTQQSGTQAGPLSSWHKTMGMAPPLGQCKGENGTKTDRERR